jgi:predicted nucleic acid-binding protein
VILVDTSVWIDHLRATEPRLVEWLAADAVGCHPAIIQELALGSIKDRDQLLAGLGNLWRFPVLTHDELTAFVGRHRLWGRGLSATDAALLGSVLLSPGAMLWARDQRLIAACRDLGVPVVDR